MKAKVQANKLLALKQKKQTNGKGRALPKDCGDGSAGHAQRGEAKISRNQAVIEKDYCAIIGLNQKDLENQGILA